ncbi:MAG: hypothetical protein IK144_04040, partial [Bacteroidaceae bacterium]|nr:hypothetical protein [Bacteroidaceae bacterium]
MVQARSRKFGANIRIFTQKIFSSRCKYSQRKEKIQPEEKNTARGKKIGMKISVKTEFWHKI